ncbi:MFS transporter [Paracoccus sulfuroxidans]|uniref:DHA1 family bicyclomycin/chloramphenicol resistance-like MFS transporter n=1 Tax=Paracoccus sulfuroxidans TaxID=384678 RepID=A0A562NFQ8_9RHOB|nr:MFS transporter [Paracoccus sulfuroxidans]TWI30966.1 DHA1 family bicyclomycin/chloramphenicol resistance-like MFS transporter [Paracoccus sulfuroxidans]
MSRKKIIMISVLLASFSQMAAYICVPALPLLSALFPSGKSAVIVSMYLLCAAIGQLVWGILSDHSGRALTLRWGLALGTVGTILCILSDDWLMLLFGRALQALGFSSCLVNSRAIIRDNCETDELQQTFAATTVWIAIIPTLTPIAGGVLSDVWGARAPFVLTFLTAALVWIVVVRGLGKTTPAGAPLSAKPSRRVLHAVARPAIWGSVLGALHFGALSAFLSNAPDVAQHLKLYAPTAFGLFLGSMTPLFILGAVVARKRPAAVRIDKVPVLILVQVGCVVVSMTAIRADAPLSALNLAAISLFSVLQGMILPAIISYVMSVEPGYGGRVSSLFGSIQMAGGALGIWVAQRMLLIWSDIGMHAVMLVFLTSAGLVSLLMLGGQRPPEWSP